MKRLFVRRLAAPIALLIALAFSGCENKTADPAIPPFPYHAAFTEGNSIPAGYTLHRFSTSDGLMDDHVRALLQDSSGCIWICNGQGLTRYDGRAFVNYRSQAAYAPMPSVGQFGRVRMTLLQRNEICYQVEGGIVSFRDEHFFINRADSFAACYSPAGIPYRFWSGYFDRFGNVWYDPRCNGRMDCLHPHGMDSVTLPPQEERRNGFPYFLDAQGNFWLQNKKGLLRYNGKTFDTIAFPGTVNFYSAFLDHSGDQWLVSDHDEIFRISPGRKMDSIPASPENGEFTGAIEEDENGDLCIAFENRVLLIRAGKRDTFLPVHKTTRILRGKNLTAFVSDSSFSVFAGGELFRATWNGELQGTITDALVDREQNIWLGTTKGLYRCVPSAAKRMRISVAEAAKFLHQDDKNIRENYSVRFVDSNGRTWFDCGLGLVMNDPGDEKTPYRDFPELNAIVNARRKEQLQSGFPAGGKGIAVFEEPGGNVLIGFDGYLNEIIGGKTKDAKSNGGLWRWNGNELKRLSAKDENGNVRSNFAVQSFFRDQNRTWIVTHSGILSLEDASDELQSYTDPLLQEPFLFTRDKSGNIFLLAHGRIFNCDSNKNSFQLFCNTTDTIANAFAVDGEHRFWLSVPGMLYAYDQKGRCDSIAIGAGSANGKPSIVVCLHADDRGNIWAVSADHGIFFIEAATNLSANFTISDGISGNKVYDACFDRNGDLWVLSNGGMDRISPKLFYRDTLLHVEKMTDEDAISEITSLRDLRQSSTVILPDDPLNDEPFAYAFYPGKFIRNAEEPLTRISRLQLGGMNDDSLLHEKNPQVSYRHNDVSISFSAVSLTAPAKVRCSHFLSGYDKSWSAPDERTYVSYTNLDEGTYTFCVRACNNDGIWNAAPACSTFTILPPWYRTGWARALFVLAAAAGLWGAFRLRTRQLRIKNEQLEKQVSARTAEVVSQKREIEQKNKDMLSSITYAKRIQAALLTQLQYLAKHLPEHFVLYLPKDIVSGDFYWAFKTERGKIFIAAADCTGHGVPGAFMSVIGLSKLHEIVVEKHVHDPARVLDQLREEIIRALNPEGAEEAKDGMDISFCAIDREAMLLEYAGANNSIYLVRNEMLQEYKADKFPVGKYGHDERPFTTKQIDLQPGDMLYLFTDGYADQFGGPNGKKFKYKSFENLLVSISGQPAAMQKEMLQRAIEEWKGALEQVDDMLVIGIRI